jgi:hypothetical protein
MAKRGAHGKKVKNSRLRVGRVVDVPLREVSAICLHRGRNHRMSLIAVGDRLAKLAWFVEPRSDVDKINWHTTGIKRVMGSKIPKENPQIEAICADGIGRILLLQETPPRVEVIDPKARRMVASIELAIGTRDALARSWSDPDGSRGEGMALLPGGHLLIAKEKKPSALIEFGPANSRARGFPNGCALPDGKRWPIGKGSHRFVALAVWYPDKTLAKACADFSDLAIGPDGRLYLLSDQSASIARLDDLRTNADTAALTAAWQLGDLGGKPEGLAFTAEGRALVALDKRKARRNLLMFEPAIALSSGKA